MPEKYHNNKLPQPCQGCNGSLQLGQKMPRIDLPIAQLGKNMYALTVKITIFQQYAVKLILWMHLLHMWNISLILIILIVIIVDSNNCGFHQQHWGDCWFHSIFITNSDIIQSFFGQTGTYISAGAEQKNFQNLCL